MNNWGNDSPCSFHEDDLSSCIHSVLMGLRPSLLFLIHSEMLNNSACACAVLCKFLKQQLLFQA